MLKKVAIATIVIMFGFLIITQAQQEKAVQSHSATALSCQECHVCKKPTTANPCLRTCPRHWKGKDVGRKLTAAQGPDVVILKDIENLYEPVKFTHKVHAEMAAWSVGCVACHHYPPTNVAHPTCKECHKPGSDPEDVNIIGLKGAYHRQCMDCHREWSGGNVCAACHISKSSKATAGADKAKPAYPPCKEPDKKVYKTSLKNGPYVTFFHNNHSQSYGAECVDCHQDQPCVTCHYKGEKSVLAAAADKHEKCSACHDVSDKKECTKCHSKTEKKGFDHGKATGWALKTYHQKLSCQKCHPAGKAIGKLSRSCIKCHKGWSSDNFKHSVTGLTLDENHIDLDCSDCHLDNRFDKKPDCSNCHDEISYPKAKPGKVVKK